MLAARQAVFRGPVMEEEAPELAVADQRIEFACGHVEQEADEDPDLHRHEFMPAEVGQRRLGGDVEAARIEGEVHHPLQIAHDRDDDGIEHRLVEDRLGERRAAELVDDANLVDDQHHLADDQRRRAGQHEGAQIEPVVARQQVGRDDDQVEGDEEIERSAAADGGSPAIQP